MPRQDVRYRTRQRGREDALKFGSTPSPFRFPMELILEIVDHLRDDPKSLQACMLTCVAWSRIVRPIVYSAITISDKAKYDALLRLVEENEDVKNWIQELRIVNDKIIPKAQWVTEILGSLSGKLPRVRALELRGHTIYGIHNFHAFNTIHALTLSSVHVKQTVVCATLQRLPSLVDLTIVQSNISDSDRPEISPISAQNLHLRSLGLALRPSENMLLPYTNNTIVPWLESSNSMTILRKVAFYMADFTAPTPLQVGHFLGLLGGSLEELTLHFHMRRFQLVIDSMFKGESSFSQ